MTEVETTAELDDLYRLLECSTVEVVRLGPLHDLWVDEEGLYTTKPRFQMRSAGLAPTTIVGRGLILQHNGAGDCAPCSLPVELMRQTVRFEGAAQ